MSKFNFFGGLKIGKHIQAYQGILKPSYFQKPLIIFSVAYFQLIWEGVDQNWVGWLVLKFQVNFVRELLGINEIIGSMLNLLSDHYSNIDGS